MSEYQVFVSSERHIRAVDESSEDFLSLRAAMEDVSLHFCQIDLSSSSSHHSVDSEREKKRVMHKITMYGFDKSGVDRHDSVPGHTLKTLLRMNMPKLQARI